jgi:hypothetical protein
MDSIFFLDKIVFLRYIFFEAYFKGRGLKSHSPRCRDWVLNRLKKKSLIQTATVLMARMGRRLKIPGVGRPNKPHLPYYQRRMGNMV